MPGLLDELAAITDDEIAAAYGKVKPQHTAYSYVKEGGKWVAKRKPPTAPFEEPLFTRYKDSTWKEKEKGYDKFAFKYPGMPRADFEEIWNITPPLDRNGVPPPPQTNWSGADRSTTKSVALPAVGSTTPAPVTTQDATGFDTAKFMQGMLDNGVERDEALRFIDEIMGPQEGFQLRTRLANEPSLLPKQKILTPKWLVEKFVKEPTRSLFRYLQQGNAAAVGMMFEGFLPFLAREAGVRDDPATWRDVWENPANIPADVGDFLTALVGGAKSGLEKQATTRNYLGKVTMPLPAGTVLGPGASGQAYGKMAAGGQPAEIDVTGVVGFAGDMLLDFYNLIPLGVPMKLAKAAAAKFGMTEGGKLLSGIARKVADKLPGGAGISLGKALEIAKQRKLLDQIIDKKLVAELQLERGTTMRLQSVEEAANLFTEALTEKGLSKESIAKARADFMQGMTNYQETSTLAIVEELDKFAKAESTRLRTQRQALESKPSPPDVARTKTEIRALERDLKKNPVAQRPDIAPSAFASGATERFVAGETPEALSVQRTGLPKRSSEPIVDARPQKLIDLQKRLAGQQQDRLGELDDIDRKLAALQRPTADLVQAAEETLSRQFSGPEGAEQFLKGRVQPLPETPGAQIAAPSASVPTIERPPVWAGPDWELSAARAPAAPTSLSSEGYAQRVIKEWEATGKPLYRSGELTALVDLDRETLLRTFLANSDLPAGKAEAIYQRTKSALRENELADMALGLALKDAGILEESDLAKYLVAPGRTLHIRREYIDFMRDLEDLMPREYTELKALIGTKGLILSENTTPSAQYAKRKLGAGQTREQWEKGAERDYSKLIADQGTLSARALSARKILQDVSGYARAPELLEDMAREGTVARLPNPVKEATLRQTADPLTGFGIDLGAYSQDDLARLASQLDNTPQYKGWVKIPEEPRRWGPVAGKYLPEHIVKDLDWFSRRGGMSPWEKVVAAWKWMKVPTNLSAVVHNTMGNMLLAHWGGGVSPLRVDKWIRAADEVASKGKYFTELADISPIMRNTFAKEEFGKFVESVGRGDAKTLRGRLTTALAPLWKTIKEKPSDFYNALEQWGKVAVYTDAREVLKMAPEEAAALAEKWLFDYRKVPHFIDYLGRKGVIPFARFNWKMLGVLPEAIATRPGQMEQPMKAWNNLFADVEAPNPDPEEQFKPDWMKTAFVKTKWRRPDGKPLYFDLQYIFPGMEVIASAQTTGKALSRGSFADAARAVGTEFTSVPILSAVFAVTLNSNLQTGIPIVNENPFTGEIDDPHATRKILQYVVNSLGPALGYRFMDMFRAAKANPEEVLAEGLRRDFKGKLEDANKGTGLQARSFEEAGKLLLKRQDMTLFKEPGPAAAIGDQTGALALPLQKDPMAWRSPAEVLAGIFGFSTNVADADRTFNAKRGRLRQQRNNAKAKGDLKNEEALDYQLDALQALYELHRANLMKWREKDPAKRTIIPISGMEWDQIMALRKTTNRSSAQRLPRP